MNPIGGYDIEDLMVGMSARFLRMLSERDIFLFAGACGDRNSVHLDEEYAKQMLLGQALDPETASAVMTIRKGRDYSAKVALSMRYLDLAFVRQSMVEFEQSQLEHLEDWLDRRAVWVEYIEGVKNRLDLNAGIPVRAVNEFGFLAKYRGASAYRTPTTPFPS